MIVRKLIIECSVCVEGLPDEDGIIRSSNTEIPEMLQIGKIEVESQLRGLVKIVGNRKVWMHSDMTIHNKRDYNKKLVRDLADTLYRESFAGGNDI